MIAYSVQGSGAAIAADGLVKRFGDTVALDGFDLEVAPGTVCGLLGPNGAGKTTAVRILTTLLWADAGAASVAGYDVATEAHSVRAALGLSGQTPAVDEILSGRQNLVLFGRLNGFSKAVARRRADELLAQFELTDAADRAVKKYSGGMRRRIDLAVTLILRAGGLVPRRADDRSRSSQPQRGVAGDPPARVPGDDGPPHHAVPRRGRSARRPGGGDGSGHGHRDGSPDELKARIGGDRVEVVLAR